MPSEPAGTGLLVRGVGLDEKPASTKPSKNMLAAFDEEIKAEENKA